ncbi:SRPBCC family protein [Nonomuraea sp. NPDC050536]|uniref:SRPBCC family protein n=1 Tax=Nonomuraea sp. NPDC050536 TaxID=3364366 RepID=UPI0037C6E694
MEVEDMLYNMHERVIPATPDEIWPVLCDIENLWPEDIGSFRLPEGLHPGAPVEHSSKRYQVGAVEPSHRLWFTITPALTHGFTLTPQGSATLVRHEITGRPPFALKIAWPLMIRRNHNRVIEHILTTLTTRLTHPIP